MSFVIPAENLNVHSDDEEVPKNSSATKEAKLLLDLALPTVIIQLGFVVPSFISASYVGKSFGAVYLDGYTLANLTGNLCTLSLLQGLYSASDTLSPQAFGAGNYREVGLLAIRGFIGSMMIIIPINLVLLFFMQGILEAIGQDTEASRHAWHFYMIYMLSFPFNALYVVTWKFLSAQNVMRPLVLVVLASCIVVIPFALEVLTRWIGFLGTPLAIVVFQVFEALSLIGYLAWKKPYVDATWPGVAAWRDALEWRPFSKYLALGVGGMLASLEWVYWEALSLVVGTLGVTPLSVHTIPTQVIMVTFMPPLGLGIALAIRLGATLPQNVDRAKKLAIGCLLFTAVVFGIMAIFLYTLRKYIFHFFTDEQEVLDGCEEIWPKVCLYFYILAFFGINMGIATGLGMQWTLGVVTIVFLWLFGLPASYHFAVVEGQGLDAAWKWILPPYIGINVVMMIAFVLKDWDALAAQICLRECMEDGDLEALALDVHVDRYGSTDESKNKLHVK